MFDINPESLVTKEQKLLYNIWEELKASHVAAPVIEETKVQKQMFDCKFCGGTHETKPQIMACARNAKKKVG